ncbi:MAG: hypothetical protein IT454_04210 [Planctomycetes bacterium]|nr:hypothetical protein [Planctomycetota bacterium]
MSTPPEGMRICPTRQDQTESLMTHTISLGECQKRQREHFHKCPTCVHANVRNQPAMPSLSQPVRDTGRSSPA